MSKSPAPSVRRISLGSAVKAVLGFFKEGPARYSASVSGLMEARQGTRDGSIRWSKQSDWAYEGTQSFAGPSASGGNITYRIEIDPEARLGFQKTLIAYGYGTVGNVSVDARKPFSDAGQDHSIQSGIGQLLREVQSNLGLPQYEPPEGSLVSLF